MMAQKSIKNPDTAPMQSLPWGVDTRGRLNALVSDGGKELAIFCGADKHHPNATQWCTPAQSRNHADYAAHACNHYPTLQAALIELVEGWRSFGLSEATAKSLHNLMVDVYYGEVPDGARVS